MTILRRFSRSLAVLNISTAVLAASLNVQIPSIASFTPSSGTFELSSHVQIVVDSHYANYGTPSLLDYARTFRSDLMEVVPYISIAPLSVSPTAPGAGPDIPAVYLTLDPSLKYELYNGDSTDEGYNFEVASGSYIIKASAPIGVWWGTRTLLQQAAVQLAQGVESISIPAGEGSDSPGWEVRGFMLDAGRHWFETSFLGKHYLVPRPNFWTATPLTAVSCRRFVCVCIVLQTQRIPPARIRQPLESRLPLRRRQRRLEESLRSPALPAARKLPDRGPRPQEERKLAERRLPRNAEQMCPARRDHHP